MTAIVKHMARSKAGTEGAATPAQPRNSQLRRQFPPRSVQELWPATAQGEDELLQRLTSPPFLPEMKATQAGRRRGTAKMLRWLSSFPGDTWQQRWEASQAEDHPGSSWAQLPLRWLQDNGMRASSDDNDLRMWRPAQSTTTSGLFNLQSTRLKTSPISACCRGASLSSRNGAG